MFPHLNKRCFNRSMKCGLRSFAMEQPKKERLKKYTHTVLLPFTDYPKWLTIKQRVELDDWIYGEAEFVTLYKWQRENVRGPEFVMHDGPPYANGSVHIGHAINKLLKDFIVRYKLLKGYKVHFVPGWDCHGLPIELKAVTSNAVTTPMGVRYLAKKFASKAIEEQREVFKSWGLLADLDECVYHTFDKDYVQNELRMFHKLYEKGLIYRDMKPVFWSPASRTALAEAELEYNANHVSDSITFRVKLKDFPEFQEEEAVYALVWTTTPWTMLTNEAVAYNEGFDYSAVRIESYPGVYLLASKLVENLRNLLGKNVDVISLVNGSGFQTAKYEHPLDKNAYKLFVPSHHVTLKKGTGFVHIAPAHGTDDFVLALKHNLPLKCLVNENGRYVAESGDFSGLDALTDGNKKVLNDMFEDILKVESFQHSYPYDWRTKTPTIVRTSIQWFVDTEKIKDAALAALEGVKIRPEASGQRLKQQLQSRPYWCISRQRFWGVPIPVLYRKDDGSPVINEELIEHYCGKIDEKGTDFWWTCSTDQLIPDSMKNVLNGEDVVKGEDILDIWFDSGISWSSVLEGDEKVADIYVEGIDQCSGWFQSSLMSSVALRGKSPYKSLFIHGFAVDEKGSKMSKSSGNVVDPKSLVMGENKKVGGVDMLRWWVANHATQNYHIPVTAGSIKDSHDCIGKMRSIFRYLLGNLYNFEPSPTYRFNIMDKYMLYLLRKYDTQVEEMYENYQYHRVCMKTTNFISNDVSAFYCHLTKDRLYCEEANSESRRAAQYVMWMIAEVVLSSIAPIVPHFAEEVYIHHPVFKNELQRIYFKSAPVKSLPAWEQPEVEEMTRKIFEIRDAVDDLKCLTKFSSSELAVDLKAGSELYKTLNALRTDEILDLIPISTLSIREDPTREDYSIDIGKTKKGLCQRCRKFRSPDASVELCERCESIVVRMEKEKEFDRDERENDIDVDIIESESYGGKDVV